ncbi:MAG: bifunctional diaminohydroxyphosphoribosylaminopyrimidine deaminase/5-amino-6-(5-phosphoribosylamino)uracil reductase RibD [Cyanobacteria bacterium P01_A01_bin.135]
MDVDSKMMQHCLALAQRAAGQTAPNPMVGAVVVQGSEIVGEGFHPGAGQPHAEVFALQAAGDRARGATVYVSLEPCNHQGRTPPCTEALIAAQVQRVVIGMTDPNPVASGGTARLEAAGIDVVTGVEEAACRRLNEAFVHRVTRGRAFGILKYAMTLDGKIAAIGGHSAWVTGPEARAQVHQLRSTCDAVVVGGNTVRQDNPNLTTHGVTAHQPRRVVISPSLNLPEEANLWNTDVAPTLVFTQTGVQPDRQAHLRRRGVEVIELETPSPAAVTAHLTARGCSTLLWECGGTLAARAVADGVIQKVMAFIAPKLVGGTDAPSPLADLGLRNMNDALLLKDLQWQRAGNDYLIVGYL